jgi:riboflavin kinase/FMN adenylyltransferase
MAGKRRSLSEPALVANSPADLPRAERAVAIGNFDGVHRGHQAVIRAIAGRGLPTAVVTFDPHPRRVLGFEKVLALSSIERRAELLGALGVDAVLAVPFTPETASLDAEDWVRQTLVPLGARVVAVGEGFRFGRGRRGDAALLRAMGLLVHEEPIRLGSSSSRIRRLIAEGELADAARLLGRPVEIEARAAQDGVLVLGDGVAVPPSGIYTARIGERRCTIVLEDGVARLERVVPRSGARVIVQFDARAGGQERIWRMKVAASQ